MPVPGLAELDQITQGLRTKYEIPGASVAFTCRGRLVYARSFGVTGRGGTTPATPDSLFRFASVSKPLASLAILRLVDQTKLSFNARVYLEILTTCTPPPAPPPAPAMPR